MPMTPLKYAGLNMHMDLNSLQRGRKRVRHGQRVPGRKYSKWEKPIITQTVSSVSAGVRTGFESWLYQSRPCSLNPLLLKAGLKAGHANRLPAGAEWVNSRNGTA